MNKLLKKLMAVGLGLVLFSGGFSLAGCDNGKTNVPDTPPIVNPNEDPNKDPGKEPDENPGKDPGKDPDKEPDNQDTPPVTEKKTLQQAATGFDALVQKCVTGKNFTYTMEKPLQKITAEFAGDKAKMDFNGEVTYLTEENGENFVIGLENDNSWHKDFAEENMSIDYALSTVTDALDGITWTEYDENLNLLSGEVSTTVEGFPVKAKIEANFDQNDMSVKMNNGLLSTNMSISKVGTTAVTLPENVIDETAESNNIFTVENGETIWNVKAIKEVLEPWLKNEMTDANGNHVDNQFGRPVFAKAFENKVRTIVFINPTIDKLEFGYILDNPDGNSFEAKHIWGWDKFILGLNKDVLTKDEFAKFLMTREERDILATITKIDLEYTTLDKDYETAHKQEFETLTKNVFEKYHNEKEANDPDYNGAKVLFAFKTAPSDQTLGDGRYGRQWSQYYLIERNNNMSLIKISPRGLISGLGFYENVLQNNENYWSLENKGKVIEMALVLHANLCLYDAPIMIIGKETNLSKE